METKQAKVCNATQKYNQRMRTKNGEKINVLGEKCKKMTNNLGYYLWKKICETIKQKYFKIKKVQLLK